MNDYEERQAERKARYEARAEKARRGAADLASRSTRMAEAIPFGQPVMLDHYSAKSDLRYRERMGNLMSKSVEVSKKADYYDRRAASVGTAGVSGDDPEAINKLRAELTQLKATQDQMKAANRLIRNHSRDGRDAQIAALVKLGLTQEAAVAALTPDPCGRVGYPAYHLSNHSANMRRIAKRIKELEAIGKLVTAERECKGFTYREDVEENRVMFVFPGKPADAVRQKLRARGFKWSPSRNAWVRQLTGNGIADGRWLMKALQQGA